MANRRNTVKSDEPVHADIAVEDDQAHPDHAETVEADEKVAAMMARIAELEAALAARPARKPREKRMTDKQRRMVQFLREHPEADIATACVEAGATATSHGFVFRLIEDGYLAVSVTDHGAVVADATPAEPDSTDDSDVPVQPDEKGEVI